MMSYFRALTNDRLEEKQLRSQLAGDDLCDLARVRGGGSLERKGQRSMGVGEAEVVSHYIKLRRRLHINDRVTI